MLAIGASLNDGNGDNSGHVRVYEFKSEPLSYSHWNNSEPNNIGEENYTMLIGSHWNDITNTDGGQPKIYLLETNQTIV